MFYLPLHIYFEAGALITCAMFWLRLRTSILYWFGPFLLFILCVELAGRYLRIVLSQSNGWLFNFSIPIEYLFFAFIFWKTYTKPAFSLLARLFIILFSLFAVINIAVNGLMEFHTNVLLIGSFFMIVFSVLYFVNFYQDTETEIIWKEPMFWIASGVLVFNMGEFAYDFLSGYLMTHEYDEAAIIFRSINNKLILVLYSFLIIGFLCARNTRTLMKA